jgi:hypothetical protein
MLEPSPLRALIAGFVAVGVIGAYEKWTQARGIDQSAAGMGFLLLSVIFFVVPFALLVIGYKNLTLGFPRIFCRSWWHDFSDCSVRFLALAAGALAGMALQLAFQ